MAEIAHFYAEHTHATTSSTTVWATGASVAGTSLTANTKYLIIARGLIGTSSATTKGHFRVETADDTNIATKSTCVYETALLYQDNDFKSWLFAHSFTTDATPADVRIQVKMFEGPAGNNAAVDQTSLLLIDLDEIGTEGTDYFEDINAATGTEYPTGVVSLATIAGADLGTTEEWIVFGSAKVGIGSTGRTFTHTLEVADDDGGGVPVSRSVEEGEDTAEERMTGFAARHKATSSADAEIRAWEEAASGNMTDEGSYLIALPASYFADFEHAYVGTSNTVTTEETLTSVTSYTPTTDGNHLVIGRAHTITSIGGNTTVWVEDGTTEIRTGDSTPTHDQAWDAAKDYEQLVTMQRYSITGTTTLNFQGANASSDSISDTWLLVLNLNEAGAATSPAPFPRRQRTTVRM